MTTTEELRKETEEGLKQFQMPGLIQVMEGAVETLSELASSTKDPESSQKILSYIGQLQGAITQAKENNDEKMIGEFDKIIDKSGRGKSTILGQPETEHGRPSEGLAALIKQIMPLLTKAMELEALEEPDVKRVKQIEKEVLETLKKGKGVGKRFYWYIDRINKLMEIIKSRDDKERKKLEGLLNGKTISQLRKEHEEAKDNHHGFLGRPRDVNEASLAILDRETKNAEKDMGEKEEIYEIAAKHAKDILKLRVRRLDIILKRLRYVEELYVKNQNAFVKLIKERVILEKYHHELSEYLIKIQHLIPDLQQHPKFTEVMGEVWNKLNEDRAEIKEGGMNSAEDAVTHITDLSVQVGKLGEEWNRSQDLLMNDEAKMEHFIDGLQAEIADAIARAQEMLDGKTPIEIKNLPLAGDDDNTLKNFNQTVFNMREHVPPVVEAVKKFIKYTDILKASLTFMFTVINDLSEDIEKEPAPTEPVQEAA